MSLAINMDISVKTGQPEKQKSHCLISSVFETRKLDPISQRLDNTSEGYISRLLAKGDLDGKIGQTLLLHQIPHVTSERVLLVGAGSDKELTPKKYLELVRKAILTLLQTGSTEAALFLTELPVKDRDIAWKIKQAVIIALGCTYTFNAFKGKQEKERLSLRQLTLFVPSKRELAEGQRGALQGEAIARGISFTKDLANTPANICTPIYLAKEAEKLAAKFPAISTAVLNEKEMAALKMGSLLSVGQGSQNPPRLITLEYRGRKDKQKPVVLIGKGITFDTGGNSLKTPSSMIGMKYDMCGAATVLGVLLSAAELELPLNIVGVIAAAENMPGNTATRPEDIVTSMSGITIEILNTDAEGRLVLCDALTYSERFNPDVVIDMATLTSACTITFGSHSSALMSNHEPLASALLKAGIVSEDKCWQLPLWDEYQEALNSNFADIANIGSPGEAGTILGGCFLSRFATKYQWAHLDIASVAARSGKERGATGRPVSMIMQYLLDRCQQKR